MRTLRRRAPRPVEKKNACAHSAPGRMALYGSLPNPCSLKLHPLPSAERIGRLSILLRRSLRECGDCRGGKAEGVYLLPRAFRSATPYPGSKREGSAERDRRKAGLTGSHPLFTLRSSTYGDKTSMTADVQRSR